MKLSEQWLREWVDPDVDTLELAEQLTMAGLEVDSIEPCAPVLDGVVVGHLLDKQPHPDADRLSICHVDVGLKESLQIVCGATNVRIGGAYPVATIGTRLPGGLKIKKSKIRGAESFGMMCSTVELGLGESADGLLELDNSAEPGALLSDTLSLDDQVIDLDLTPNRADCFSVLGAARDVAAVNELPFAEPDFVPIAAVNDAVNSITLAAVDACPVFAGRVIRNIDGSIVTPLWMAERLRRSGIRPLSPVVDVTNYVMLELGQPMHAYDLAKLEGALTARMAGPDEQLTLLDGQKIKLADDVLIIADDNAAVALAGIMGGAATAVTDATTDIFLESAYFSPQVIAGRARRFGLHTEASLRFERGVDFTGQVRAIERATQLLLDIVGGEAGPVSEERNTDTLPVRSAVVLRRERLMRLLGIEIPDVTVVAMLTRLGFSVNAQADGWSVTPTPARFDIAIEEDLIEEVVRLYGYDQVPEKFQQSAAILAAQTESRVPLSRVSSLLTDRGYQEVITYSFVDPDQQTILLGDAHDLALANPLSAELSVMRRSLWLGLLQTVSANQKRQQERVRIFEQGVTFALQDNEIVEKECLAGVAWGRLRAEHWDDPKQAADLFDIRSDIEALIALTGASSEFSFIAVEHEALRPGRTARIERDGKFVGWLGELHPRLVRKWNFGQAPILFELETGLALAAQVPVYREISRFPSVRRDLAVIVNDNISADDLLAEVRAAAGELLRDVRVFDVYTGNGIEKGLKSVALGLILQETSSTLTELEIEHVSNTVIDRLSSKFNASIRE
ncbi:MAG: phenylalanine--tRNA ligase subunit beta [Gammaproteobacteria bacterium]|nr:phenylalanine--tRNA ligase subunit beta [Gammaproteobacteria bacterium]MCP4091407.1 phenylalanine--tRNA ligase subunit beta [Gammaproteobacteria bacterium]MCP4831433.1 phenylalanine--tRNA ligase subunit beta [Gammaproteobacteria bacterium]MCP4930207.1 phenylalanine--tRNA ligase subunit beta [Gammaproteobacteria bacterium]